MSPEVSSSLNYSMILHEFEKNSPFPLAENELKAIFFSSFHLIFFFIEHLQMKCQPKFHIAEGHAGHYSIWVCKWMWSISICAAL